MHDVPWAACEPVAAWVQIACRQVALPHSVLQAQGHTAVGAAWNAAEWYNLHGWAIGQGTGESGREAEPLGHGRAHALLLLTVDPETSCLGLVRLHAAINAKLLPPTYKSEPCKKPGCDRGPECHHYHATKGASSDRLPGLAYKSAFCQIYKARQPSPCCVHLMGLLATDEGLSVHASFEGSKATLNC